MEISVSGAKARPTDLAGRSEAGAEAVLTRFGEAAAGSVPVAHRPDAAARRAVLDAVRAESRAAAFPGPDGARSQDFLHNEGGLPR